MGTGNVRSGSGNLNITSDIGLGVTGWIRYHATWQNNYNQSSYDINLELIYSAGFQLRYCQIDGKNGSYSVTTKSFISNGIDIKFGIDSSGNYGYYKVGADTVTPFKTGVSNLLSYSGIKSISQGTWDGVTLSSSSWKALATSSIDSSWTYTHNLNIDPWTVQSVMAAIIEETNWIRQTRGGDSVYRYSPYFSVCGFRYRYGTNSSSTETTTGLNGYTVACSKEYDSNNNKINRTTFLIDNFSPTSSSVGRSLMEVVITSNEIIISFKYSTAQSCLQIKSLSPNFFFNFTYGPLVLQEN